MFAEEMFFLFADEVEFLPVNGNKINKKAKYKKI